VPVHIVEHPLVHDALVELRDKRTPPDHFRRAATRISVLLAAEALREAPSTGVTVETPIGPAGGRRITREIVVVPVLRAGMGMLEAVLDLVPHARVGHIGLQRDETTALASRYYSRFPTGLDRSFVLLVDPMLATGGSSVAALRLLHDAGARDIRIVCIVAAPEGLATVEQHFPHVSIYTPVVDQRLNEQKYIVPGLGDFGDRLYGTL
jgi:uracil phosphoribosyltransferase